MNCEPSSPGLIHPGSSESRKSAGAVVSPLGHSAPALDYQTRSDIQGIPFLPPHNSSLPSMPRRNSIATRSVRVH